jgi:hypothetical protein
MANRPIHVVESGGDSTGLKEFADGADSGVQLPSGTTAQRDSSASAGEIRFNSTTKKIEFYDGAKWNSNSYLNVDDAEYDGVMTIESTRYVRDSTYEPAYNGTWLGTNGTGNPSANHWQFQKNFGASPLNNSEGSKFLPFEHPDAHAGATNEDLRLGPVGYNSLESEVTKRATPILELATNPAQSDMNNNYNNIRQKVGAIAFTVTSNDYFNNSYVSGGAWAGNKAFVSGITNNLEGNGVGYYGYDGVNNVMTFWNSAGNGGPYPAMSFGSSNYDGNTAGPVTFLLGRFNRDDARGTKIELVEGNNLTTNKPKVESIITTGSGHNISHEMTIHTGNAKQFDDSSANWAIMWHDQALNGRMITAVMPSHGYKLQAIGLAQGYQANRDYKVVFYNSNSTTRNFKFDPDDLDFFQVENNFPTGPLNAHNSITSYATAVAATTVTNVFFDSSFPTGGSDTTYAITQHGFISFDMTSINTTTGNTMGSVLFSNLKTDAI